MGGRSIAWPSPIASCSGSGPSSWRPRTTFPTGAALAEAVELGGLYGSSDDTSRFVNGVLAAVADEVRETRPWKPVECVVLDMDGVIRHWLPEYHGEVEARFGLEDGLLWRTAFSDPGFRDVTIGTITAEEWAAQIGAAIVEGHPDVAADEIAAAWLASNWRIDDDVVALIDGLRDAGTAVALFSNASSKLEADLAEIGIDERFVVVANSSRIGLAKPDVAAFRHVAGMLDAEPGAILFVDDRRENVAGAVEAGWHSVQMRSAARLGAVLRRLGIDGAPDPA